jgi:hypothetical protein
MFRAVVLVGGLLCLSSQAAAQMNSSDLKWGPAPAVFPAGAQMAVLSGDPTKAGVFVVRLKTPRATRFQPIITRPMSTSP